MSMGTKAAPGAGTAVPSASTETLRRPDQVAAQAARVLALALRG